MKCEYRPPGLVVTFEGSDEVEVVSEAFREHNDHLRSLGNDNSVGTYEMQVAGWRGDVQQYRAPNGMQLMDKLRFFAEETEPRVDAALDGTDGPRAAARRYRLGAAAEAMLETMDAHAQEEADERDTLD